jgi:hypothetical protein
MKNKKGKAQMKIEIAVKVRPARTKVITPLFRVSFPHVFQPHAMTEGQEKKYSVAMLFDKKTDLSPLIKLAKDTMASAFGAKAWDSGKYRKPFRDGDEKSDLGGYKGTMFAPASSFERPGLIDSNREDIISEEDFYAGCYAKASVTCYSYDQGGNKGVAFGLQNLIKLKEGERFSSRSSAQDDFNVDELKEEADKLDEEESTDDI